MNTIFTGFEPFGGETINVSREAVKRLTGVQTSPSSGFFRQAAIDVYKYAKRLTFLIKSFGKHFDRVSLSFSPWEEWIEMEN